MATAWRGIFFSVITCNSSVIHFSYACSYDHCDCQSFAHFSSSNIHYQYTTIAIWLKLKGKNSKTSSYSDLYEINVMLNAKKISSKFKWNVSLSTFYIQRHSHTGNAPTKTIMCERVSITLCSLHAQTQLWMLKWDRFT